MKKYICLVFALFGMLSVGSCNDDDPVASPIPGEDEEVLRRSLSILYWYKPFILISVR